MPTISALKERYAFATTLEERQDAIRQHAVTGTDEWYYYRGLTLLAQLQETVSSVAPRQPTEAESELVAEIRSLLHQYSRLNNRVSTSNNYRKLNARFHLLLYPLDSSTTTTYIRDQLHLVSDDTEDPHQQPPQEEEAGSPKPTRRVKPGDFDPSILEPATVLDRALARSDRIEALLAFPCLRDEYEMEKEQQVLHELLSSPHSDTRDQCDIVQRLARFLDKYSDYSVTQFQVDNLTIEQMERLMQTQQRHELIEMYIGKLGKDVDRVWSFVKALPDSYNGLKYLILFHKIKDATIHGQFEDHALFESYWRVRSGRRDNWRFKEFPSPSPQAHEELVTAYLAGALAKNPELRLQHFDSYETELKHKHASILLTRVPSAQSQEHWRDVLGAAVYRNLVDKSELGFGYSTLHAKETSTTLQVVVKNIPHVSIRVFAIDLQQYWRLHPSATSIKVDSVDGLCPTWEKEMDFSKHPAIQTVENTIDLEKLAPEVFASRGAWVVDFVGGRESCRAIIQKGRLRHICKDTSAGHLFRILDEKNAPVDAKILYRNEYYEVNEDHNILIPYRSKIDDAGAEAQMLILHDEFCEPLRFTCKQEDYTLDINCYVNPESLVPNRQTKVVVNPRLTIYDEPVPLHMLESVSFTVDATNSRGVKSTFTQHVAATSPSMEFEFTVPNSLSSLAFRLRGQVQSADGTSTHDVDATHATEFTSMGAMASAYLRADADGYFIQVLGKNGEPQRNTDVHLEMTHTLLSFTPVEQKLRTNDKGTVRLGKLDNVSQVIITAPVRKVWQLLVPTPQTPSRMNQQADQPFKIPGEFVYCALFQLLDSESVNIIHDCTSKVAVHDTYIDVQGLPEGAYQFHLASKGRSIMQLECIIIASDGQQATKSGHWSDWVLGKEAYAQTSSRKPLYIDDVQVSENQVIVNLNSTGSSKAATRAIVTASAFVSEQGTAVARLLRSLPARQFLKAPLDTEATFLTGRKLSEEFQYVLNRARTEKWLGSTLTKPSVLMYPDERRTTTTQDRNLEKDRTFTSKRERHLENASYKTVARNLASYANTNFAEATNDLTFLNHRCPSLIVTPDEQGQIAIDREKLGDGNILHIAVQHGEQVLIYQRILDGAPLDLKLNDLSQQGNSDILYVRTKAVAELLPQQQLTLDLNHEWEVVDSFEKVFTLFENMSNVSLGHVDFLKRWSKFTDEEKLKKHDDMACHELNLWIKFKDVNFFAKHIRPYLESKLFKTFMDYYLLDDRTSLQSYADSINLYEELSVYEKALLAKKIPELLPVTLQAFLDTYTPKSDANFDAVLAGSTLQQPGMPLGAPPPPPPGSNYGLDSSMYEQGEQLNTLRATPRHAMMAARPAAFPQSGFGRSLDASVTPQAFGAQQQQQQPVLMASASVQVSAEDEEDSDEDMGFGLFNGVSGSEGQNSDDNLDEFEPEDEAGDDEEDALREALRQRQGKKLPFRFTKPTKEWAEKGYYQSARYGQPVEVNRFWIDYLESDAQGQFLSGNFIYAINSFTEIMFALALSDLPFKSQWKQESDIPNNKLVITVETPCLVFYRQLKEAQNTPPANPSVLLGQNFFLNKDNVNANQDELDMVDPADLEPATEYGWHVAISNVSSKRSDIEVTLQVPVGSIPTGDTPYCQSRTLQLQPYSTWQSVVGSFYFPSCGEFGQFPVTVSCSSLLAGATSPLKLHVKTPDTVSASSSWTALASSGADDQVMTHLLQANLEKVDLGLLRWRLGNPEFARKVIDTLRYRRFYSIAVWQYALHHRFPEAIRELLENEKSLLGLCGTAFESPLVSSPTHFIEHPTLVEYAPAIPARQHQLGALPEIRNSEMYRSYTAFLDILAEKRQANNEDLLILTVYLILQERLGEARKMYQRIHPAAATIQHDYLGAYLETRVRADLVDATTLDLSGVREIAEKYIHCSQLKWRKMFASLRDFVDEVERQQHSNNKDDQDSVMPERQQAQAILTEPVLDFDLEQNELVLHYSKVKQVEIRYYKTDVEAMFSHNPFNRSSDAGWVKPHVIQKIDLNASDSDEVEEQLEPYEVIGVGKANIKTRRISLPGDITHAIVQINGGGLKRRKPYFSHSLLVHLVESYGMVRVADKASRRPIAGTYVKVYARLKESQAVEFWKDGYTGLNGVFDYVNVTEASLEKLQKVDKFSLLVSSVKNGAVVEEVYPPSSC
ncbi:hypothetical protein BDB00DRAFT_801811 [Zychaea mexicana]|uniref:uncharacterized protein n=1 Tax=Zychaea mexicana TaxID=64656 RepID=UPI0022FF1793|nr:uncharacterized protein BDB00DRAFT_801811 [Zychaea mexicana]KAI9498263.1 hypothetical protein BDB00DRAFT_801811 [Zychaea mexicana]